MKNNNKQALKSSNTKEVFFKAAMECYVKLGYALTTTTTVAEKAKLSRGAMVHHFPSKKVLVKESIDFINKKRIEQFKSDINKFTKQAEKSEQGYQVSDGLDVYFNLLHSKYSVAYFELRMAARTDRYLADILLDADTEFESVWMDLIKLAFPEWNDKNITSLQFITDVVQVMLEGLTLVNFTTDSERRTKLVLLYAKACVREMFVKDDIDEVIKKYQLTKAK
jgi:AcrR family transcriptional regulator